MITVTGLRWVPPFIQGLVRDLRVRWALEEAGLPYRENLIGPEAQASDEYRRLQPFGQVPVFEEDGFKLFESGAIVMHIGERTETLLPRDPHARARTNAWMFAALNSVEPAVAMLGQVEMARDAEWAKLRRPAALEFAMKRLAAVSHWLGDREYLEDRFTAADLLMTTVFRNIRHMNDVWAQLPDLVAYRARCEARPAFAKALAAQMAAYERNAPRK
jgi:glutathione S-transferase